MTWIILTGEYPPAEGGVADYTRQVAQGLAASGATVHVWTKGNAENTFDGHVFVHHLPTGFTPASLRLLTRELERFSKPARLLIQYVPHAFGYKGMNVPFCWWFLVRRGFSKQVMFHEVAYPLEWKQPLRHSVLAVVTRLMASMTAATCDRVFVSIPAWADLIQKLVPGKTSEWLPVPSNLPTVVDAAETAALRQRLGAEDGHMAGHFGTFGGNIVPLLMDVVPRILTDPQMKMMFVGRDSDRFAARLAEANPGLQDRVISTGALPPAMAALHLSACDFLVQPYIDGVSARRGSVMAGLALGVPIVTTTGHLTESIWQESGAVELAPASDMGMVAAAAQRLAASPEARQRLSEKARMLYQRRFAVQHTLSELLNDPGRVVTGEVMVR